MTKRKVTDLLPTEAILISSEADLKVLEELERVVKDMAYNAGSAYVVIALSKVLTEINRLKSTEIEKLKLAFAEGGAIPQSAESWVRKFKQSGG